jgi:hypothetical protein
MKFPVDAPKSNGAIGIRDIEGKAATGSSERTRAVSEFQSSARPGRPRVHDRARTRTHFDGADEPGWNADSADAAKSRHAEGVDSAHDLFAIRDTARRFHWGLSQRLTSLAASLPVF